MEWRLSEKKTEFHDRQRITAIAVERSVIDLPVSSSDPISTAICPRSTSPRPRISAGFTQKFMSPDSHLVRQNGRWTNEEGNATEGITIVTIPSLEFGQPTNHEILKLNLMFHSPESFINSQTRFVLL